MRSDNQHKIQNQTIGIEFENTDDSFGLPNRIADVFYQQLQPRMEILFDEMFGKDQYALIDKLEIDCGLLKMENWEQEFAEQAIRKLKEELAQVNKKVIDPGKTEEITAAGTFFFFLENGYLPWNKRINSIAELEKLLIVDKNLITRIKKLILQKPKVAGRLAYQFSENFVTKIVTAFISERIQEFDLLPAILAKVNTLRAGGSKVAHFDKHMVNEAVLQVFAAEEDKNSELQFFEILLAKTENNSELHSEIIKIIKELRIRNDKPEPETEPEQRNNGILKSEDKLVEKQAAKLNEKHAKEQAEKQVESGNEEKHLPEKSAEDSISEIQKPDSDIYISNAGLVLLHPFLSALFEKLNLAQKNTWIDEVSQQKAVLILEFLVTGKDEMEEFDLMLNKIICGLDIAESFNLKIQLDDEIKSICASLLTAVISHWSALGNTGIDGLRESFLQRNGILSKVDNGWLLKVEQRGFDILLDRLPWGIGIVKLPWMNEMLYVEWR